MKKRLGVLLIICALIIGFVSIAPAGTVGPTPSVEGDWLIDGTGSISAAYYLVAGKHKTKVMSFTFNLQDVAFFQDVFTFDSENNFYDYVLFMYGTWAYDPKNQTVF